MVSLFIHPSAPGEVDEAEISMDRMNGRDVIGSSQG